MTRKKKGTAEQAVKEEHQRDRDEREEREWLDRIRAKNREKGALTRRQVLSLRCTRVKRLLLSDWYLGAVLTAMVRDQKLRTINGYYYVDDPGYLQSAGVIARGTESVTPDPRQLTIQGVDGKQS